MTRSEAAFQHVSYSRHTLVHLVHHLRCSSFAKAVVLTVVGGVTYMPGGEHQRSPAPVCAVRSEVSGDNMSSSVSAAHSHEGTSRVLNINAAQIQTTRRAVSVTGVTVISAGQG